MRDNGTDAVDSKNEEVRFPLVNDTREKIQADFKDLRSFECHSTGRTTRVSKWSLDTVHAENRIKLFSSNVVRYRFVFLICDRGCVL